jgi:XrtN system VIT domain protein
MRTATLKLQDPLYFTGLALLTLSFLFYLLPVLFPTTLENSSDGLFLVNYFMAAGYLIVLMVRGLLKRGRNGLYHVVLFLLLSLVSAYALNREVPVFEKSVPWLSFSLIAAAVNFILFIFFESFPAWMKYLVCAVAGFAFVIFAYLAIYLIPLYVVGIVAFLALGISLHTFVPMLICICTVLLMIKVKRFWKPFFAGVAIPLVFTIFFVARWNSQLSNINETFRYSTLTSNDGLPTWVRIAQKMPQNDLGKKILKTELVYAVPGSSENFLWSVPDLNFEERIHDPLVMVSTLLCGSVNVPQEDRVKILEAMYDARHEALERLWSGKDLVTEKVQTKAQLWPSLRIAYTEMEVIVSHVPGKSLTNTQEAVYTFYLPEGGVVTALSLWIDGREEKGILTTKSKADSAYKTIVGVERRDPSVVHWQEGNTVSVRVFPVPKGASRMFKLGITAPLTFEQGNLKYESIYFRGPSSASTQHKVQVTSEESLQDLRLPHGFSRHDNLRFSFDGAWLPSWSATFKAAEISRDVFTFNGYNYGVKALEQIATRMDLSEIYLDINSSWSPAECDYVFGLAGDKKVYVSDSSEGLTHVTKANRKSVFDNMRSRNFSLFPFFKIRNPTAALVISKSAAISPSIDELRGSHFLRATNEYFHKNKSVRLFNIGDDLSPYLKSLREFRMLDYSSGGQAKLSRIISAKNFNTIVESEEQAAIHNAGISLVRLHSSDVGGAPDHLMRLFAYNRILQRTGRDVLAEILNEEGAIAEAQEAYVVSPFSSLVVLETARDYERFDIASSKNSLQNASLKSQGAVPEPHEWALIVVVILLFGFLKFYPMTILVKRQ